MAYHSCMALPAAFTQPRGPLLSLSPVMPPTHQPSFCPSVATGRLHLAATLKLGQQRTFSQRHLSIRVLGFPRLKESPNFLALSSCSCANDPWRGPERLPFPIKSPFFPSSCEIVSSPSFLICLIHSARISDMQIIFYRELVHFGA